LKVDERVRTAKGNRNQMVVLNVEVRAALDAATPVTLEDGAPNLSRDHVASRLLRQRIGRKDGVCTFELAFLATVALIDKRVDVLG
jgi:hypothetical protein